MNIELAGRVAMGSGLAAWQQLIIEPKKHGQEPESAAWIDKTIRTPAGLDWSWMQDAFDADGEYEWCGAFGAYCWAKAGLDLDLRRMYWSSTDRLNAYAQYKPLFGTTREKALMARFPKPADPAERRLCLVLDERSNHENLAGVTPREGDILLVGNVGSRMGTHVTVVERYDQAEGGFYTVEGNARGQWPDGKARPGVQGVTRNFRPLGLDRGQTGYHARRLIRPSPHDLTINVTT